ncbi:MAG TPA: arginase family protein [Vicinamibacteria bacterium]|nr:arginase family protein [Vicinamibacteria bacterium]
MAPPKMAVFGVPSAAGARGPGVERAAFALREAGLLTALARHARVVNLSDLSLFPWRDDPGHPKARNAPIAACAARAAGDEMARALEAGFTLVIGGDCSLLPGTAGGVRQALGRDVGVVHVDANADLNTPETTPSGQLDGMALALALGRGVPELAGAVCRPPAVRPEHATLVGYRELDPGEVGPARELALALSAEQVRERGAPGAAAAALAAIRNEDGPVLVHFDVDVLDPEAMPVKDALTPGRGLAWDEAEALLVALVRSPRVVALELCEFNPARDEDGRAARHLVELLERGVAARAAVA